MKKIIVFFTLILLSCPNSMAFEPYVIEGLEASPKFWQVRPSQIEKICSDVKKGRAEVIAKTPLGFPVYAVFYGDFNDPEPQTNFSAGNSSSAISAYVPQDHQQTILFVAGVHGSEPECVASAVNMINLLETGKDLKGDSRPEFLELARNYRLIIVPCLNMDGRSICPDHFRGQPYEIFRGCSQGWWKDGSLVGWRGSKEYFPLPIDKVKFPGGYPNSLGYNIMHDVTPGDVKTEEAKALLHLMAKYRVDLLLNGHSCEYQPFMCACDLVDTPQHIRRGAVLCSLVNVALFTAGIQPKLSDGGRPDNTINLSNATNWCSGGLGMTLECSHSCYAQNGSRCELSFEQMMEPAFISMEIIMRDGLREPLACRPGQK